MNTPYSGKELRQSSLHFLGGKAISSLLTVSILMLIVRILPIHEYGVYVTLVAGMELALALSSMGLPWMTARYLPEYRIHAKGHVLNAFVIRVMGMLAGVILAVSLLLTLSSEWLLTMLDITAYGDATRLYLAVLLVEGVGRNLREHALGPLLQQGVAQISLVVKNLSMLLLLAWLTLADANTLVNVVAVDLASSCVSTVLSILGLKRYLNAHYHLEGTPGWAEPEWSKMRNTALHMYYSYAASLAYSPQMLTFFVQRSLGVEATAMFGFLRKLYDLVSSYLPAGLLFGLVRPKLVASFTGGGGIQRLSDNSNLIGKVSLFVLMPLIVIVSNSSEQLVEMTSGGKFLNGGGIFFGFMLTLILSSQRLILESVAVIVGRSDLCSSASLACVIMLPVVYVLLLLNMGLWAPVVTLALGSLLSNYIILRELVKTSGYRVDLRGLWKLLLSALMAGVAVNGLLPATHGIYDLFISALFGLSAFLVIAYFVKPFTNAERERINKFINRNIFVW